jgi:RimJ/RimL family protein N-acetyltransferase
MWSDPEVTRFIGGRPQTREEAWARVLRYAGMWSLVGKGFWVVESKDNGAFLGEVGVMEARRDMAPPLGDHPEVGWAFLPSAQGQGFASEAVERAIRWAEQAFPASALLCIISPDNAASLRVAARFGFVEKLRTTYHGEPTIQFERPPGGSIGRRT